MQITKRTTTRNDRGMAVGMILLACLLLAALSMAMSFAAKTGMGTSDTNMNDVLASALLDQAALYTDGMNTLYAKTGCIPVWINIDPQNPACSMMSASYGTAEPQQPPAAAFTSAANAQWIYKTDGGAEGGVPNVKIWNVGTNSYEDYMVVLAGLTQGVCQRINQKLLGSTNIPVLGSTVLSDWSTATTWIDLTSDSAVNGVPAECVKTTDGGYVFYNVTWPQ